MVRAPRRNKSSITIRTVAERAGVSAMTVSNVLNGRTVRPETLEAVRAAMIELDYRPNTAARKLASASAVTVGFLHAHPLAEVFSDILSGLLLAAPRFGLDLIIEPVVLEHGATRQAVTRLVQRGVQGIVLPPVFVELLVAESSLSDYDVPFVTLATGRPVAGLVNIRIDEVAAAREVVDHMIARGCREFAFIDGPDVPQVSDERRRGYCEALRTAGLPVREDRIAHAPSDDEMLLAWCDNLLAGPNPPDAIFAWNDCYAAMAMLAAHRRGLDIPADVAIAGFDDTSMASKLWPPLTSVRHPIPQMTEMALTRLVQAMAGGDSDARIVVLEHQLKVRSST